MFGLVGPLMGQKVTAGYHCKERFNDDSCFTWCMQGSPRLMEVKGQTRKGGASGVHQVAQNHEHISLFLQNLEKCLNRHTETTHGFA